MRILLAMEKENIKGDKNREGPLIVEEENGASCRCLRRSFEEANGASMDHEDGADKKFKEVLLLLEGVVDEISNFHVWVVLVFSSGSKFVSVYLVNRISLF